MLTLDDIIINYEKQIHIWINGLLLSEQSKNKFSSNFKSYHTALAVQKIHHGNFNESKNDFYICGLIDEFRIKNFNDRFLDYDLPGICLPILSDNEVLIRDYASLKYSAQGNMPSMEENIIDGGLPIWCNTVQYFMVNNKEGVERNLNIIELKSLKKLTEKEADLKDDYIFYNALNNNDKAKIEEMLEKLTSAKIHKRRNANSVLNQYISLPALGYAKLAWRRGIEVNVESKLIPKELLPVVPLKNYFKKYAFLDAI